MIVDVGLSILLVVMGATSLNKLISMNTSLVALRGISRSLHTALLSMISCRLWPLKFNNHPMLLSMVESKNLTNSKETGSIPVSGTKFIQQIKINIIINTY